MTSRPDGPNQRPGARPPSMLPYAVAGVLLALLLFGAAAFLWLGNRPGVAIGGPFTLQNGAGQTVTDRSFRGKYMLVYFGYTYCPDVCPTTLQSVAGALDALGAKADRIAPIFITVDPARDTPAVMQRYTAAFSPRLVGLTGTPEQIAQVTKEYHVYAAKHVTGPGPNDYSMDHSSILYLMGPDGQFIAPVQEQPPQQMAADLTRLMTSGG
ncbi:MAG TPA: SCO family protein [Acetobacteraceae bacterium]|nr:SCO family protein [Acetobacteraceae bacterium]